MSFYEDASLVMIPSGYKSGKIYSQKPLSTDGQLTFTRASDATRVASNGLIEKVLTNILLHSEAFDNAVYNKGTGGSISANSVTAPDGTMTADAYTWATATTTYAFLSQTVSGTSQIPNTFSIYIKRPAGSGSRTLRLAVSDVTISTSSSSTFTITESWQRFQFTRTSASTTGSVGVGFFLGASGVSIAAGEVIDVWGAQLETGDIATDYIATTTAAVSVGPVANIPRLDYLNSTCPKLLLEPQRTNLVLFSEQLNAASWSASTTTVTANAEISPDGYQNADVLAMSASQSRVSQVLSLGAGTYSVSVYAKAISGSGTARILVIIDGVSTDFNFTPTTSWARYSFTFTAATSVTAVQMRAQTFIGNLSFWGCQLEVGAYPTSYIPTLGASQTRVADAASKTGISSLINSAEGVLYFEGSAIANDGVGKAITLLANASNFVKILFSTTTNRVDYVCISAGAVSCNIVKTIANTTANNKIAIKWKNNDFALWINGVKEGVDVSGNAPIGMSILNFTNEGAGELFYGNVKSTIIFPITLTDSQLAELTAL